MNYLTRFTCWAVVCVFANVLFIGLPIRAEDAAHAEPQFRDITPDAELAGWVVEGTKLRDDAKRLPVWSVADGVVRCAGRGFGFLRYDRPTCDFVLQAEFKMSPGCNSGLGIRTVPFTGPRETRPSFASYEIQILDDRDKPVGLHSSMSLYRYVAPTASAAKRAGEWNELEVTCIGPKIQVVLNGQTVQDVDQSQIDELKSKPLCGYISLQNHGRDIEWRGLKLKELKAANRDELKAADRDGLKAADQDELKAADRVELSAAAEAAVLETNRATAAKLTVETRKRTKAAEAPQEWEVTEASAALVPEETAIILCDVWDKHWCKLATQRCDVLARKMAPLLDRAREQGVHIIHCPSDTMDFYQDHPARKRIQALAKVEPPIAIAGWCHLDPEDEGPLPIDDSDGGCDDPEPARSYRAWKQQHPAISVREEDVVTDDGQEVYNYLQHHRIKNVIYVGVHTNMCVLGRSFGIRQMTRMGFNTLLVRDLTDTMYNPKMRPMVSHDEGTELVIQHVEKYWCPTITSESLTSFSLAADSTDKGDK